MKAVNDIKREARRDGISDALTALFSSSYAGIVEEAALEVGLLWKCGACDCLNPSYDSECEECGAIHA